MGRIVPQIPLTPVVNHENEGTRLREEHLAAVVPDSDSFLIHGGEVRALRHHQNKLKAKRSAKNLQPRR